MFSPIGSPRRIGRGSAGVTTNTASAPSSVLREPEIRSARDRPARSLAGHTLKACWSGARPASRPGQLLSGDVLTSEGTTAGVDTESRCGT